MKALRTLLNDIETAVDVGDQDRFAYSLASAHVQLNRLETIVQALECDLDQVYKDMAGESI